MLEIMLAVVLISSATTYGITSVLHRFDSANSNWAATIAPNFATALDTGLLVGFLVVALGLFVFASPPPEHRLPIASILVASVLAYLFGIGVVRYQLSRVIQAGGSLTLMLIPIVCGVYIHALTVPGLGVIGFPLYLAGAFALLWTAAMLNTVHYLSRMDGLALPVVALASGFMAFQLFDLGQAQLSWYSLGLTGACVGAIIFSILRARVRLGPAGTFLLALAIATFPLLAPARVIIGLTIMIIPLTDLAYHLVRGSDRPAIAYSTGMAQGLLSDQIVALGLSPRIFVAGYVIIQAGLMFVMLLTPSWTFKLTLLGIVSVVVVGVKTKLVRYRSTHSGA